MKKLLIFLFCLASVYTNGQIYVKPNSTYGTEEYRRAILSTFHFPTGCGVPTDSTFLNEPGIKVRQNSAALYYDSCSHAGFIWDPQLRAWVPIGSGSGGGVDSVYNRGDSAFYRLNGNEKFAFLIAGSPFTTIAQGEVLPPGALNNYFLRDDNSFHPVITPADTMFIHNTLVNKRDILDTLHAHLLMTLDRGTQMADSVNLSLRALISAKVTNYAGVAFWGYGLWSTRPTIGAGLYASTGPDSVGLFYINGVAVTRLTDAPGLSTNIYVKKGGGRGINIARADSATSSLIFKGIIDSGRISWHLVVSGSDTVLAAVLDTVGLGGGGGTANLALGTRTPSTIPITNSNGTGVTLPTGDTTNAGLIDTTDAWKLAKTLRWDTASGAGHKPVYFLPGYLIDIARFLPIKVVGSGVTDESDSSHIQYRVAGGSGGRNFYDLVQDGGADSTGVSDVSVILNAALAIPNRIVRVPSGKYRISHTVGFNADGVSLLGVGRGSRFMIDTGCHAGFFIGGTARKNITIDGFYFNQQDTITSGAWNSFKNSHIIVISLDTTFVTHRPTDTVRDIYITHNYFTGKSGYVDAVFQVAHRNTWGGVIINSHTEFNVFENLGGGGGGILGESDTVWFRDIYFRYNIVKHIGLLDRADGFAWSASGWGKNIVSTFNHITDAKTIGIEHAGLDESYILYNVFDSLLYTGTAPFSINNTNSGKKGYNNMAIGNIMTDSIVAYPYVLNQDHMILANNSVRVYGNDYFRMGSITNSRFENEQYVGLGTPAPVISLRTNSLYNTFKGCTFVGNATKDQTMLMTDSSMFNTFDLCSFFGHTNANKVINESNGARRNIIFNSYSGLKGTNMFQINMPIAGQPTYEYVIDSSGNMALAAYGGAWQHLGNYIFPAFPSSDSVAIGGTTPTHRLHLIGDAAFDYSNPDSTKSSLSAFQYIVRQTKGGGSGLTFNNLYIASQINTGDSVANMNEVTVDPSSVNGKALNWTAYKVLAGTFPNIGNYTGVDVQNPASIAGTAVGVRTNISVGTGSYSMYNSGAAPSFFFGSIGINNTVPVASASLDIVNTAKGILIPRMSNAQMLAIASPASYLMVFNTDSSAATTGGLYYYDPLLVQWRPVCKSTGSGSLTLAQNHLLVGNSSSVAVDGGANMVFTGSRVGVNQSSPTAVLEVSANASGATVTDTASMTLSNNTSSTSSIQQSSPSLRLLGHSWNTTTTTDRSIAWKIWHQAVSGATGSSAGILNFDFSLAGGAYTNVASLMANGSFVTGTLQTASATFTGGSIAFTPGSLSLYSDATGLFKISRSSSASVAPTAYRIYNLLNGSNVEYAEMGFQATSNVFTILPVAGGTGTLRPMAFPTGFAAGVSTAPAASATVDIGGTTKGFLIPRVTTTQMVAISSPATGLQVWNSDSLNICVYTGTAWRDVGYKASGGGGGFTNPMSAIGDIIYGGTSGAATRLAGNTTTTKQFYSSTGTGSAAQAPVLGALASGDIPNNAANTSGTAANLSGTPALPNGTTATTQATHDSTTKVTNNLYVDRAVAQALATLPTFASGLYTPTVTNGANVTTNSSAQGHYIRVGNQVTVDGSLGITPTIAVTPTTFQLSLPTASGTFANGIQASGIGGTTFADPIKPTIISTVGSATVTVAYTPQSGGGAQLIYFHFQYQIQ